MLRREGELDRLACWSGALTDGGAVDHHGSVDPHGVEGFGQQVSECEGRGWMEGGGGAGWVVLEGANGDRNGTQKRKIWVLIRECL